MQPPPPANLAVLVPEGHTTSALSVVRSLAPLGIRVTVAGESGRFTLAAHSRWTSAVREWPSPETAPERFRSALERELGANRYDVLIPTTDTTIAIVEQHREVLERHTTVALPPSQVMLHARDKGMTIEAARRAGVAVPLTRQFETIESLEAELGSFSYPCVIKPRFSRAWDGTGPVAKGAVRFATSADAVRRAYAGVSTPSSLLVQEAVTGTGTGVVAIVERGHVLYALAHRRLREANPMGGRAALAETLAPEPRLMEPARRLFAELGWTGVGMVEFKDPGGDAAPYLMEVNGRFWGSLPLAAAAGVNFPLMLVEQALGRTVTIPPPYQVGVRCRHLPSDISYLVAAMKGRPRGWTRPYPSRAGALADILPWPGRWKSFNFWSSDPAPAILEFVNLAADDARSVVARVMRRRP